MELRGVHLTDLIEVSVFMALFIYFLRISDAAIFIWWLLYFWYLLCLTIGLLLDIWLILNHLGMIGMKRTLEELVWRFLSIQVVQDVVFPISRRGKDVFPFLVSRIEVMTLAEVEFRGHQFLTAWHCCATIVVRVQSTPEVIIISGTVQDKACQLTRAKLGSLSEITLSIWSIRPSRVKQLVVMNILSCVKIRQRFHCG